MGLRVLVLGGTGSIGRLVIDEALERGHGVTALVRDAGELRGPPGQVTRVAGDALDRQAMMRAVAGQDAIIYALGAGNVRQTTLFSESTKILIEAMRHHGVRRLVCLTGVGAGDTKGHGGFLYDRILYPLFTKGVYADKDIQESLIRDSACDWTIVRPASFRNTTPAGPLQVVTNVDDVVLRSISRREVAVFLVDALQQNRYVRQAVFIGHA